MASSAASNLRPALAPRLKPYAGSEDPASISDAASFSIVPATQALRICHVMTADMWAGAEVQLATTAAFLRTQPDVRLSMVLFNDGPLAQELRRLGIDVTIFDEARTNSLAILSQLTRYLAAQHADVVHVHRYKDTILGALAARFAGVPHVVRTVHGLHEPGSGWAALKLHAYEMLDTLALRGCADIVVAVSKHMAGVLCRSGYWPGMVATIHNGIELAAPVSDERVARIRAELGIEPHALLIGTAGRLVPVKGHSDLVRAVALVKPRIPGVRLLVAGAGPLHGELVDAAARLGIADTCVFPGHRSDVRDLIAAMDIFALPSLSEGIPMALLEAMSLGVPVVATRVGGIPEVVQHRYSGLLVPSGDAHAIADACLELSRYPDWAQEIGAAGQRVVREEYTRERAGRALLDTYRSLVRVGQSKRAAADPVVRDRRQGTLTRRVLGYPGRVMNRAVERERMRQIRRDPAELTTALRTATSVLVLCHGNIIRSAFAAELLRRRLNGAPNITVRSAGLGAVAGRPAHPHAITTAATREIDLGAHVSSPIDADLVAGSDVIFVMEVAHLVELASRFPSARAKTFLMTCLAPQVRLEVPDPVNDELPVFESCFSQLTDAVAPVARLLSEASPCR